MDVAPIASLLAGLRLLGISVGARLGGKLAGCPSEHCRRLWCASVHYNPSVANDRLNCPDNVLHVHVCRLAMVTQAGVAIGLAKNVPDRVPDLGADFSALLMAIIVLNQLAGPPMLKQSLLSIGEGTQSSNSSAVVRCNCFPSSVTQRN